MHRSSATVGQRVSDSGRITGAGKPAFRRLEWIFLSAARLQRRGVLWRILRLEGLALNVVGTALRRWRARAKGSLAPVAIALSPTMSCNLACQGCYALDYPRDGELSLDQIDDVLGAAERLGVFLVIVTGGEPLLRDGVVDLLARHKRLLFLLVTNGTLIDREAARAMARGGNIVPVVSLEGPKEMTDRRRGEGVYESAVRAMEFLNGQRLLFGFSATVTGENWSALVADRFVEEMIGRGCVLGFYTEYVPVGRDARRDWILAEDQRRLFREGVLAVRRKHPIIAVHLPDDEYDRSNRCLGVTGGCVHLNAQGCVEPCPFAHYAADNVRETPLAEALESPFLREIRASEAVVRCGHIGCALVENRSLVEAIAARTGARSTERVAQADRGS